MNELKETLESEIKIEGEKIKYVMIRRWYFYFSGNWEWVEGILNSKNYLLL